MKVYAFVKIIQHPQPDGSGAQYGDVVSFHRIETRRSKKELQYFFPVPVDINIPCGEQYDKEMKGRCGECEFNDPDLCDVQKYCRAEWPEGDVFEAPKPVYRCRFKLDINSNIDPAILAMEINTEEDITEFLGIVSSLAPLQYSIEDKVVTE